MKESCFSAKLRRQRCCLAERCLQGILPACRRPYTVPAHQVAFSTKQVVSPVLTSATGAAFLVCARKQSRSAFARLRSHRQRLRPVIHTLCSRGREETTRRRFSREKARDTDEKNRRDDPLLSRAQRKATCVGVG